MQIQTRIAAIIIHEGKLLLLKGKGYNELRTPGGKVEGNESHEECIRREIQEEINGVIVSFSFFQSYEGTSYYNADCGLIQYIYLVKLQEYITLAPGHEIEKLNWISREDFVNKRYSMIDIIEQEIIPDIIKEKLR